MSNTTSNTTGNGNKNYEEEIGALWKRKSKSGMTYLAGHVKVEDDLGTEKTVKVVLFSNRNKTNENQPDFRMYVSKVRPLDGDSKNSNETQVEVSEAAPQEVEAEEVL